MRAFLQIILRSFLFRKRRTFLTVLGIVIGSTLILTLVLLGDGIRLRSGSCSTLSLVLLAALLN